MPFVRKPLPIELVGLDPIIGAGLSRAVPGSRTKLYTVLVRFKAGNPMKMSIRAESPKKAAEYANNRWPGAAVEVLK
jgi:hypothetical protein